MVEVRNVSGVFLSPAQPRVLAKPQGVSDEHQSWMLLLGLARGSTTLWPPKALASMSECKYQAPGECDFCLARLPLSPRKDCLSNLRSSGNEYTRSEQVTVRSRVWAATRKSLNFVAFSKLCS